MKKGDLVVFTGRGTSPLEGMFGGLMQDSFKDDNGYEDARVYFANAPIWPERIISLRWLKPIHVSRQD